MHFALKYLETTGNHSNDHTKTIVIMVIGFSSQFTVNALFSLLYNCHQRNLLYISGSQSSTDRYSNFEEASRQKVEEL